MSSQAELFVRTATPRPENIYIDNYDYFCYIKLVLNISNKIGSDFMQLTRGAEYAIRAVLDLTSNHTGQKSGKVQLKDIAARMDIPDDFLAKIFQMLNRSGIVKSYRGTKGGYALAREPKDINLKDVIYAVDGPIRLNKCLHAEGCREETFACQHKPKCPVHDIWTRAQESMLKILGEADFHTLNQKMLAN